MIQLLIYFHREEGLAKDVCDRHQILLRVVNSSYSAGLLLLRCQKKSLFKCWTILSAVKMICVPTVEISTPNLKC